jgi:hypothetical protein
VLARIAESWPTHLTRRKAEPIKEGAPLVQTCIVHLIRNSLAFVSWKDRKSILPSI